MASLTYIRGSVLFAGSADWAAPDQSYQLLLASDEYKPSRTHKFVSQVRGELSGGGYERKTIAGRAVKAGDAGADCFADAVAFTGLLSHQTYRYAVLFKQGKTDADSGLIACLDMTGVSLLGISNHTINWDGQAKSGRVLTL